jgi:hypothetical protein
MRHSNLLVVHDHSPKIQALRKSLEIASDELSGGIEVHKRYHGVHTLLDREVNEVIIV